MVKDGTEPQTPRTVWERPEPNRRTAPAPLSRERIVEAAIALADAQGLAAVSIRKVGAALSAGPMRLYGYLSTKEDLFDLMVDAIYGELAPKESVAGTWREAIQAMARRTRLAARAHPWFSQLLAGRPHQGPNALAHLEAALAALTAAPGFQDIDSALRALRTINAYVIGAIQSEAAEVRAEQDSGMSKAEWQRSTGPYIQRVIGTGRFPNLARLVREAAQPSPEQIFDAGLALVLDGIAGSFPAR